MRAKDESSNASFGSFEKRTNSTKIKEKVNQPMTGFDVFASHSSSKENLDEKFSIPKVKTLRLKRMEGEIGLRRSTCVK